MHCSIGLVTGHFVFIQSLGNGISTVHQTMLIHLCNAPFYRPYKNVEHSPCPGWHIGDDLSRFRQQLEQFCGDGLHPFYGCYRC